MSKLSDKEIQEMLDHQVGENEGVYSADKDLGTYRTLFKELDKMPHVTLPYGFSGQTIKRLEESKSTRRNLSVYVYTAIAAITGLVVGGLILEEMFGSQVNDIISWIVDYKWMLLLLACTTVLIQLADKLFWKKTLVN